MFFGCHKFFNVLIPVAHGTLVFSLVHRAQGCGKFEYRTNNDYRYNLYLNNLLAVATLVKEDCYM